MATAEGKKDGVPVNGARFRADDIRLKPQMSFKTTQSLRGAKPKEKPVETKVEVLPGRQVDPTSRTGFTYGATRRPFGREEKTLDSLKVIRDMDPMASHAVWNYLRLINPGHDLIAYQGEGLEEIPEQGEAQQILNVLAQNVGGEYGGGLDQLHNVLALCSVTYGAVAAEVAPTEDLKDIEDWYPIDPTLISFERDPETRRLVMGQRWRTGKFTELNTNQVFYMPLDPDIDDPYGRPPMLPAIQSVVAKAQLLNDVRAAAHNAGYPRLNVSVVWDKIQSAAPPQLRDPGRESDFQDWAARQLGQIVNDYQSLQVNDTFIHFDYVTIDTIPGGGSFDWAGLEQVLQRQLSSALKTLPILIGINDSTSETHGSVQWQIQVAGIQSLQRIIKRVVEKLATTSLQLLGYQAHARVEYETIRTVDRLYEAQAEAIEGNNLRTDVEMGWRAFDEAAEIRTGHPAFNLPVGFPPPWDLTPDAKGNVPTPGFEAGQYGMGGIAAAVQAQEQQSMLNQFGMGGEDNLGDQFGQQPSKQDKQQTAFAQALNEAILKGDKDSLKWALLQRSLNRNGKSYRQVRWPNGKVRRQVVPDPAPPSIVKEHKRGDDIGYPMLTPDEVTERTKAYEERARELFRDAMAILPEVMRDSGIPLDEVLVTARVTRRAYNVADAVFGLGYRREMKKLLRDAIREGMVRAGAPDAAPPRRLVDTVWRRNEKYIKRIQNDLAGAVNRRDIRSVEDMQAWLASNEYREVLMGRHLAKQGLWGGFAHAVAEAKPGSAWLWTLGYVVTEHCDTCLERSGGTFSYEELISIGFPGSDSLDCQANCHCSLEETEAEGARSLHDMSRPPNPELPIRDAEPTDRIAQLVDAMAKRDEQMVEVVRSIASRAWTPEEEAKHPKYPAGAEGSKGGEFAPKDDIGLTSVDGGGAGSAALSDEHQRIRQRLGNGEIHDLMTLEDAHINGGIREDDCAVGTIDGMEAFLKRGQDAPSELAAFTVNRMLGRLVNMPEMVARDFTWEVDDSGRVITDDPFTGHSQAPGQLGMFYSVSSEPSGPDDVRGWDPLTVVMTMEPGEPGVEETEMDAGELHDLAVFDALIANNDRHRWNILTDSDGSTTAIDHGLSFFSNLFNNQAMGHLLMNRMNDSSEESTFVRVGSSEDDYDNGVRRYTLPLRDRHRRALRRFKGNVAQHRRELQRFLGSDVIDEMIERADAMLAADSVLAYWSFGEPQFEYEAYY